MNEPSLDSVSSFERRKVQLETAVLASVVQSPKSQHEIRKFVQEQPGFEWVSMASISETTNRLRHQRRLVLVWRDMQSIASYTLPLDPGLPCVRHSLDTRSREERTRDEVERERKIIAAINWPRFFHIPCEEDLLPMIKTRTGYDVRVDMNRF